MYCVSPKWEDSTIINSLLGNYKSYAFHRESMDNESNEEQPDKGHRGGQLEQTAIHK